MRRQHPQRRDAVDQRVVRLEVDGEPAVVEALDQVHLPQRTVPVEQGGVQPRAQREQLEHAAGCGSALLRTWCSRSNCWSTSQPHCPSDVSERRARFWNSGATSVLGQRLRRTCARDVERVAPSGGSNSCRPPTCIGCSRVSASRNIELVGDIGTQHRPSLARPGPTAAPDRHLSCRIPAASAVRWPTRSARGRGVHLSVRVGAVGRRAVAGIGVIGLQRHVPDAVRAASTARSCAATSWQSCGGRTSTCADTADRPGPICHTCRSCTSATPSTCGQLAARARAGSTPRRGRLEEHPSGRPHQPPARPGHHGRDDQRRDRVGPVPAGGEHHDAGDAAWPRTPRRR